MIGEGQSPDGKILILQCLDGIFIPIFPYRVKHILEYEAWKRLPNNLVLGKYTDNKNETAITDSLMGTLTKGL